VCALLDSIEHRWTHTQLTIMRQFSTLRPVIGQLAPFVRKNVDPSSLSPAALAFVGDSVWTTAVRERAVFPPIKWMAMSKKNRTPNANHLIRAETQYEIAKRIRSKFLLTEVESDLLRKGGNAAGGSRPKRLDFKTYAGATGLEVLVGHLHFANQERLDELLDFAFAEIVDLDEEKV